MSEFLARLSEFRSRFDVREQATQLTLISIVAAVVIVAALVALPRSDEAEPARSRDRTTASSGEEAGDRDTEAGATTSEPVASGSARGSSGPGSSTVSGRAAAPAARAPSRVVVAGGAVKVGITYTADAGQANAAAGFTVAQIDQRRGWEAVVADINRDPPFGRKIVPVWYSQTENEITQKGAERVAQEACARFTQDTKVFMVWDGTLTAGDATLRRCLTKAKVPQISFGTGTSYGRTFKDFPYVTEPASAAMDRMAAFYVDGLFDSGFFRTFKNNRAPYSPVKPSDGKPRIGSSGTTRRPTRREPPR